MPTTTTPTQDRDAMQDAVRNWHAADRGDLSIVAFPFTSRRLPRQSQGQRTDAR